LLGFCDFGEVKINQKWESQLPIFRKLRSQRKRDRLLFYCNLNPVWWALSLGACLGGNGTFIAAAANLVGVNILKRQGKIITFKDFFRINIYYSFFSLSLF